MENKKYLWIFSESNEAWYTDLIIACTSEKKKAQEIWDSLKVKSIDGRRFEYTVVNLATEDIIKTIGRCCITRETDYTLEN